MKKTEENFKILLKLGKSINKYFWSEFSKVSSEEILNLEKKINRKLPEDFKYFYINMGYGNFCFANGGGIDSPDNLIEDCHSSYYGITGSLTLGKEWASYEEQRKFYVSYGEYNPNPTLFTKEAMYKNGTFLLDLLTIGSDGGCSYHQLNLGSNVDYGYCLLGDGIEIINKNNSFLEGMIKNFNDILENS